MYVSRFVKSCSVFLLLGFLLPEPVGAIGVRQFPRESAVQGISIPVTPLGVAISFVELGETVEYVHLSPVGEITVTGNRELCQGLARMAPSEQQDSPAGFPGLPPLAESNTNNNCSGPVQVLFVKRVAPIFVPGQLPSPSGSVLMQVLTRGSQGSYIYQFNLIPSNKRPQFTVVNIVGRQPISASQFPSVSSPPPLPSPVSLPSEPNSTGVGVQQIPNFGVPRPQEGARSTSPPIPGSQEGSRPPSAPGAPPPPFNPPSSVVPGANSPPLPFNPPSSVAPPTLLPYPMTPRF